MIQPVPTEYLYAVQSGRYDGNDDWRPARVVAFRITKKTRKRIFYMRGERGPRPRTGYVDRQKIAADGEICNPAAGWWASDFHLYLAPPETGQQESDLAGLKAAMAAAHPDRGGSHAAFIAARKAYEDARAARP